MDKNNLAFSSSISPSASLLGTLFVGLKLTGYINWPWIWVLAPFWVPVALVLVLGAIAFIFYFFVALKK